MGIEKDLASYRAGKKEKRGSVNNKGRLESFKRADSSSGADWGGCNSEKLQGVIQAVTELGGAVTFGMSRDQGAHSLTLMLDDERAALWFNGNANLNDELDNVFERLSAMTYD